MSIHCITFDLDETLWETGPALERAEQALHRWIVRTLPDSEPRALADLQAHRQHFYTTIPEIVHDLTQARISWLVALLTEAGYHPQEAKMLASKGFEVFAEWRSRLVPFDGVQETLAALKERYRVGAITNGNADVRRVGIDHLLDFVITPVEAGAAKPDAAIFRCALDTVQVRAQEAVHVGDDPVCDIAGAAALGMKTIWMNPAGLPWPDGSGTKKHSPTAPDAEIRTLSSIIERIERW
ncbi:HAD family hydrolase [Thioalkalivibrio sp. HK1]|uniref:HAD family hydrolase n=1 Tax=Thioalkalivibrio sp. HK1 TaxID=1469245 RepID=UPI000471CF0A|nr:HAD family hydrolase [Thioalkalivibrio sp. HK1]